MLIRHQILLSAVLSCLAIAGVMAGALFITNTQQENTLSSVSTDLYEASWADTSESSYITYLEKWNPDGYSVDYVDRFGPRADLSDLDYPEPGILNQAIGARDEDLVDEILSYIIESDLDEGLLSFVMVFDLESNQLFCGAALDYGLDPCDSASLIDPLTPVPEFLQRTVRAKRQVVFVRDVTEREPPTINQALAFPIKDREREIVAVAVLARNVFANIELFEERYGIRAAVLTPEITLSMENYGASSEEIYGVAGLDALTNAARGAVDERNGRVLFTQNLIDSGVSFTVLALSDYLSAGLASIAIFRDQSAEFDALTTANSTAGIAVGALIIFITLGLLYITSRAFAGITSAINVLDALGADDLDAQMPKRKGLLASDDDEVGHLKSSLESYRETLLENKANAEKRFERRRQRDQIILEKMGNLAEQLDGEARHLMLGDIARMRELSQEEAGDREDSSIEMMSLAFTRMSDEVNQLIKAKTEDMEAARDEAISANRNRAQFFNNMSHELRTPLNAVLGYSEMLQEECEDLGYDDLLPDIERINSSGRHLLALINDVLDLSKIEAGKMEIFPTNFDIENVIEMLSAINTPLAEKTGNKYFIENEVTEGAMFSDETKLRQIMTNFLSNGFKNTEEGSVTLRIQTEAPSEEFGSKEMIRFSVVDTGTGIPPEALETLFDEFTQVQTSTMQKSAQVQASTGLGLAVTKRLAQMMGGTVTVTSEMGVGSNFSLIIPRNVGDDEEDLAAIPETDPNTDSGQPYVVLIDDDPSMHELVKRTLNKANITLVGATDGERGLQIVRGRKPDLILLDVYMSGRDGWSILREIKTDETIQDVPVAMVTQLSEEKFAESLGADGYFTKPIDRSSFVKEINRLLGSDAAEQKVMIIDDDANTRELLSRILTDEGFSTITASDGLDGLDQVTGTINDADRPRLIVLDIEMPRMDGLQFLDAYAEQVEEAQHVPIVIFSGKDMSTTQKEILEQFENVKGFVPKGDMSNLTNFISNLELHRGD